MYVSLSLVIKQKYENFSPLLERERERDDDDDDDDDDGEENETWKFFNNGKKTLDKNVFPLFSSPPLSLSPVASLSLSLSLCLSLSLPK